MGVGHSRQELWTILSSSGTTEASREPGSISKIRKILVDDDPSLIVIRQTSGDTVFHLTAASGNMEAFRTLVAIFRSPSASFYKHLSPEMLESKLRQVLDVGNVHGATPLMLACARGHTEFAVLLLSLGANPHPHDEYGLTAVHHAARGGYAACMKAVLDSAPSQPGNRCPTLLHDAASAAGFTALHFAVAYNHTKCVELLLEAGAKLNARSRVFTTELGLILSPGSTALHIAAKKGLEDIAMLILRHYARRERTMDERHVNVRRIKDADGRLPVEVAYLSGCSDALVEALDPAVDIEDVFSAEQLNLPGKGVTRLSYIAAAVLRNKLMLELDAASNSDSALTSRLASESGPSTGSVCGERDLPGTCNVCMEHSESICTGACSHKLCTSCARQLCSRIGDRPPACPFCRRSIGAFKSTC